jgi:hypothetical protein
MLPDVAMAMIRELRVHPIQELHPIGEPTNLELDQDVEMIRHQHERVACPVESFRD